MFYLNSMPGKTVINSKCKQRNKHYRYDTRHEKGPMSFPKMSVTEIHVHVVLHVFELPSSHDAQK